MKLLTLRWI